MIPAKIFLADGPGVRLIARRQYHPDFTSKTTYRTISIGDRRLGTTFRQVLFPAAGRTVTEFAAFRDGLRLGSLPDARRPGERDG